MDDAGLGQLTEQACGIREEPPPVPTGSVAANAPNAFITTTNCISTDCSQADAWSMASSGRATPTPSSFTVRQSDVHPAVPETLTRHASLVIAEEFMPSGL